MKKSLFATLFLLTLAIVHTFGEEEVAIVKTGTATGISIANTTTSQHFQMIYPASLFHGTTTDGFAYDFEYINEIELFINQAGTDDNLANAQVKMRVSIWTDAATSYSSNPASFLQNTNPHVVFSNIDGETTKGTHNAFHNGTNNVSGVWFTNTTDTFKYNSAMGNLVVDVYVASSDKVINWYSVDNTTANQFISQTGDGAISTAQSYPKLSLKGSRIVKNAVISYTESSATGCTLTYTCDLHTGGPTATLNEISLNSARDAGAFHITYSEGTTPAARVPYDLPTTEMHFDQTYFLAQTINYTDNIASINNSFKIDRLGNNVFNSISIGNNVAFILPASLTQIGIGGDNRCFHVGIDNSSTKAKSVTFIHSSTTSYPKVYGTSNTDFTNPNCTTNFYFLYNIEEPDGACTSCARISDWTSLGLTGKFKSFGYCIAPYKFDYSNDKSLSRSAQGDINNIFTISTPPYGEHRPLVLQINSVYAEKNYDGAMHHYSQFDNNSMSYELDNNNQLEGKYSFENNYTQFTCTIPATCAVPIVTKYYGVITGEEEDAFLDASDISAVTSTGQSLNQYVFLNKADSLVFETQQTDHYYGFRYTNNKPIQNAPNYIKTKTPIFVKRVINNANYSFFSMPFNCKVSEIDVRYLEVIKDNSYSGSGNWTQNGNGKIDFTNANFTSSDFSLNKDCYIIYEYIGQNPDNGGEAVYSQLTESDPVLLANKGYAFVIVESDNNYGLNNESGDYKLNFTVTATIKFKYQEATSNTEKKIYINTYSGFTYADAINTTTNQGETEYRIIKASGPANQAKNKNWNLVGNPFYHEIAPASFGGKYVTVIGNKGNNRNVVHRSVIADQNQNNIPPFTALFIQATPDPSDTINKVLPIVINPSNSYPSVQSIPSVSMTAGRHEVVSVNFSRNDTVLDFTSVINDATRDRSFRFGDDLSKMFNPGGQIYTCFDGVSCAFKELAMREAPTMRTIPLGVKIVEDGQYTFSIDTSRHYFYGAVLLHDKQMNQYYNLTEQGVSFQLTAGTNNTRFELVAEPSELPSDVETVETSETLDAYVFDGKLVVDNIAEGSTLSIFDASGRMLYTTDAAGSFNYQFSAHGVYVVVLQGNTTGSVKVVY